VQLFILADVVRKTGEKILIKIVEINDSLIAKAGKLVAKFFPSRSLPEMLTFWAFRHRKKYLVKK
jgi:hypothetical protein